MSRTDHHAPYRLWDHYGLTYHDPVRMILGGRPNSLAEDVRIATRRARRKARENLRNQVEPEPYLPRHNGKWEIW